MSEWWRYSPADLLMYSARTYLRLVENLRAETSPLDVIMTILAMLIAISLWRGPRGWQAGLLALAWLTTAWLFFWQRYAAIHSFGNAFAIAFALQGLLLGAWVMSKHAFRKPARSRGASGLLIVAIIIPLSALVSSRNASQVDVFGLSPDATAMVTLAWLVAMPSAVRWLFAILPTAWLLFSAMTLWTLAMPDGIGLVALLIVAWIAMLRPVRATNAREAR
ncbi:MAG: DUF6064 family protein [Pseudomarimonas sp.]